MLYEELYVIKDSKRYQLDLNIPSGITLNFKSNLFGDVSKITASYTYTFKLPMTANNRKVLGLPEEIRTPSPFVRSRMKAEFIQNGVNLLGECNLYLGEITNKNYNAVLTWGVINGFNELKDNDISLRELCATNPVIDSYNASDNIWTQEAKDFSNNVVVVHPYRPGPDYGSGYLCVENSTGPQSLATIPGVPIYKLIELINQTYNVNFKLGNVYSGSGIWDGSAYVENSDHKIINRGIVPLVDVGLTANQLAERSCIINNLRMVRFSLILKNGQLYPLLGWNTDADFSMEQIIQFDIVQQPTYKYFDIGSGGNLNDNVKWVFYKKENEGVGAKVKIVSIEKFILDGCITATIANAGGWSINKKGNLHEDYSNVVPKFVVYRKISEIDKDKSDGVRVVYKDKFVEVGTVEGKPTYDNLYQHWKIGDITYVCCQWKFDFRKAEGFSPMEIIDAYDEYNGSSNSMCPYFFGFDKMVYTIDAQEPITITPAGQVSLDRLNGLDTDIFSNLPDISCMTFLKSLFYIIGAYPIVNNNGEIIPVYYSALRDNVNNGRVCDWSNKLATGFHENPEKIAFTMSNVAQVNYYLLKNDDLETRNQVPSADEDPEDVYEDGYMHIDCQDRTLDKDKTIIQLPWYGPWLKEGKAPNRQTYRDMKYSEFDVEKDESKRVEAKPAIGIVIPAKEGKYVQSETNSDGSYNYVLQPTGKYRTYMEIYNPFKSLADNPSYEYLQRIISAPCVVTEVIRLNEFDLRDLDYSVPVYLDKYNSYFAIVSIQRDSKGKCKCELIKLP